MNGKVRCQVTYCAHYSVGVCRFMRSSTTEHVANLEGTNCWGYYKNDGDKNAKIAAKMLVVLQRVFDWYEEYEPLLSCQDAQDEHGDVFEDVESVIWEAMMQREAEKNPIPKEP